MAPLGAQYDTGSDARKCAARICWQGGMPRQD